MVDEWEDHAVPMPPKPEAIEPRARAVTGAEQLANASKTPTLRELADAAIERMKARGKGSERKLPVPWRGLARLYAGDRYEGLEVLRPGVHVLVGGTGSGKTQLALSIALEAARAGAAVTYAGLELDEVGIIARLMGIEAARGKEYRTLDGRWAERWSSLDWPDGPKSRDALDEVAAGFGASLEVIGSMRLKVGGGRSGFDAESFGALLDEAKAGATPERPALVVLDFLQLLAANPGQRDDREIRTRIARASYLANNATLDGRLAVLLVSATARDKYGDLDSADLGKLPAVGGLVGSGKESGEIEYSAASVLVMARPAEEQKAKMPDDIEKAGGWGRIRLVALAKGRHGGSGWAMLGFDGGAFYDIDADGEKLAGLKPATEKKPAKSSSSGNGTRGAQGDEKPRRGRGEL